MLLIVLISVAWALAVPPPLSSPIDRAEQALNGLFRYYQKVETKNRPIPKKTGCPCHHCNGEKCAIPDCVYCGTRSADPCPSKQTVGCYTTAKSTCTCNLPPGPVPANATSPATYFFACGQMGGLAPSGATSEPMRCTCEVDWPSACTFCYRWWSAVALEAAANYAIAAELALNESLGATIMHTAESMWIHSPYNSEWDPKTMPVYIDDFAWYAIAYLRVYDLTRDDAWRRRAAAIVDWAWTHGWDNRTNSANDTEQCGGFWWNTGLDKRFKDSISIVEVLHAAARLATPITADSKNRTHYLNAAEMIWNWLYAFDNGTGLFASNGIMSTGAQPEMCCNSKFTVFNGSLCANSRIAGMSYNHGLLMSSAAILYNVTSNRDYLRACETLLDAAAENLTNADGAVKDLQRGSRAYVTSSAECTLRNGDPGSDFFSFKGVFITHLAYFAQTLNDSEALTSDMYKKVVAMVRNSSENAWSKSIVRAPFPKKDLCSTTSGGEYVRLDAGALEPKFHWWWTSSNVSIETPPDPHTWFVRKGVRCTYNATSVVLWKGKAGTQNACREKCERDKNCTKFMFFAESESDSDLCECYTCDDQPCNQPRCSLCGLLKDNVCPYKNSTGCYTTAKAVCTCVDNPPEGNAVNCWLYGSASQINRTYGQACAEYGNSYTVGVKRPSARASCSRRCGGNVPDVCYCDVACARHMDCCLDYALECGSEPSCAGRCEPNTTPVALPIRGGGYCYCDSGCSNYFTDNNSYGGCCADYTWRCGGGEQDQLCLDARTQTQAVSLFTAHHVMERMANANHKRTYT